jgi:hypothetical protein
MTNAGQNQQSDKATSRRNVMIGGLVAVSTLLVAVRDNVAALKKQGRSRDETVAAKPTAAFDAKFGNFVIDPGFFTRLVYEGV